MEKQNEIAVKSYLKELLAPWMRKVCESSLQTQKKDPNILLFASWLSAQRLASMPTSVLEEQEDEVVQNRPPENICLDTALPRCRAYGASEQHLGHGGGWGASLKLPSGCLEWKKGLATFLSPWLGVQVLKPLWMRGKSQAMLPEFLFFNPFFLLYWSIVD